MLYFGYDETGNIKDAWGLADTKTASVYLSKSKVDEYISKGRFDLLNAYIHRGAVELLSLLEGKDAEQARLDGRNAELLFAETSSRGDTGSRSTLQDDFQETRDRHSGAIEQMTEVLDFIADQPAGEFSILDVKNMQTAENRDDDNRPVGGHVVIEKALVERFTDLGVGSVLFDSACERQAVLKSVLLDDPTKSQEDLSIHRFRNEDGMRVVVSNKSAQNETEMVKAVLAGSKGYNYSMADRSFGKEHRLFIVDASMAEALDRGRVAALVEQSEFDHLQWGSEAATDLPAGFVSNAANTITVIDVAGIESLTAATASIYLPVNADSLRTITARSGGFAVEATLVNMGREMLAAQGEVEMLSEQLKRIYGMLLTGQPVSSLSDEQLVVLINNPRDVLGTELLTMILRPINADLVDADEIARFKRLIDAAA